MNKLPSIFFICSLIFLYSEEGFQEATERARPVMEEIFPLTEQQAILPLADISSQDTISPAVPLSPTTSTPQPSPPASKPRPSSFFKGNPCGCFIQGEWLYWKTTEGGTEFAATQNDPSLITNLPNSKSKSISFKWKSGFRVGAGYVFGRKGWDLFASYTHFQPRGSQSVSATLFPLLLYQAGGIQTNNATFAKARWSINFKCVDAELGRKYFIGNSLSLRPQLGMKWAEIDQNVFVTYGNTNPVFSGFPVGTFATIKNTNDFKGIGPRFGLTTRWKVWDGFAFFGKVAGSLLVGNFHLRQIQQQMPSSFVQNPIDLKSRFHQLTPVVEILLGIDWMRLFWSDQFGLTLSAAFEGQYFWNQNQMEQFVNNITPAYIRRSGDLGMYGLTLSARFDF